VANFPYFNGTAVPYTFVSVNRVNNEAPANTAIKCAPALQITEPFPLNNGKLATKYMWIYGCFFTVYADSKASGACLENAANDNVSST